MRKSLPNLSVLGVNSCVQQSHRSVAVGSGQLADIHHEIHAPLSAVLELSRLALDHCEAPAIRGYLETIHQATTDLIHQLKDALDSDQTEAGGIQLKQQPFDLPELVNDLHVLFCATALSKGLHFEYQARFASTRALVGDRLRIKQVLMNLLSNALEFTNKGSVCLNVELRMHSDQQATLVCEVRDTGIGMDGPLLARGADLGLSVSQNLLQMMGSNLEFGRYAGWGSLFRFKVDLAVHCDNPKPYSVNVTRARIRNAPPSKSRPVLPTPNGHANGYENGNANGVLHAISALPSTESLSHLSKRELEVMKLIVEGLTSAEIAVQLFIAKGTAEVHRENIMRKLGVRNIAALVKVAVRNGMLAL